MRAIASSLAAFRNSHGSYPMVVRTEDLEGVIGFKPLLPDGWGTTYRYECLVNGAHYRLTSAGKNKRFGRVAAESNSTQPADDIVMVDGAVVSDGSDPHVYY